MTTTRERRWWTMAEDDILKKVIQTQLQRDGKISNWTDVAVLLPGRTNKDCRKRWSKIQLDIRKGAWTQDEDERLQQAVEKLGFKWSQVATAVQSRNADQCSKRWQHVLGPDFKHSPWTPEEDKKLLKATEKHGNNWKQIGIQELPDRSTHDIRNRSLLLGRRNRSKSRAAALTQQPTPEDKDESMAVDGHEDEAEYDEDDDEDDDDNDDSFGGGGFEYDGSSSRPAPHHQSVSAISTAQDEAMVDTELDSSLLDMAQFHRVQGPFDAAEVSTFEADWASVLHQEGCHAPLPTPSLASDSLSWLNPSDVSISTTSESQYAWGGKGDMNDGYFNPAGSFEQELFDLPQSVGENTGGDATGVLGGGVVGGSGRKKGSVTLTLSQVNADVAQEIMGSVLKHSADLKIRCIVEDS